jgi:hypothetical protein
VDRNSPGSAGAVFLFWVNALLPEGRKMGRIPNVT